jgi:hypothetical protein
MCSYNTVLYHNPEDHSVKKNLTFVRDLIQCNYSAAYFCQGSLGIEKWGTEHVAYGVVKLTEMQNRAVGQYYLA